MSNGRTDEHQKQARESSQLSIIFGLVVGVAAIEKVAGVLAELWTARVTGGSFFQKSFLVELVDTVSIVPVLMALFIFFALCRRAELGSLVTLANAKALVRISYLLAFAMLWTTSVSPVFSRWLNGEPVLRPHVVTSPELVFLGFAAVLGILARMFKQAADAE